MYTMNFQIFNFYCGKNNDQWKLAGEVDTLRRPFLKTTQDSSTPDQGSRTAEEESTTEEGETAAEEEETAMNPDEYEKYILDELAGKKDYIHVTDLGL